MKRSVYFLCLFLMAAVLTGCGAPAQSGEKENGMLKREIFAMDTIMDITLYGEGHEETMNKAIRLIQQAEADFSVTRTDSDIARLNSASGSAIEVSEETYELVEKGLQMADQTEGLLDISIYPVVKLWGFTTGEYRVPEDADIQDALKHVNYKKIHLLENHQIQMEAGMQIDLGAVAKGYLSQKLTDLFRQEGVEAAVVSLGGNVQTMGKKPDGNSFVVGVTDPADGSGIYGILETADKAVVTSGIYQRYFEENGTRYHHIIDRRTGRPADNGLASVTVIADDGTEADGLATALYVMGEKKARKYQKNHPEISLILIRKDGSFWQSEDGLLRRES